MHLHLPHPRQWPNGNRIGNGNDLERGKWWDATSFCTRHVRRSLHFQRRRRHQHSARLTSALFSRSRADSKGLQSPFWQHLDGLLLLEWHRQQRAAVFIWTAIDSVHIVPAEGSLSLSCSPLRCRSPFCLFFSLLLLLATVPNSKSTSLKSWALIVPFE